MDQPNADVLFRAADRAARKYGRRLWWEDLRELQQEAWMAVLQAAAIHDPGKGELSGWCYRSACWHLREFITQRASPVRAPRHRGESSASRTPFSARGLAVSLDAEPGLVLRTEESEHTRSPEDRLAAAQVHDLAARVLRAAIRRHDPTGLAAEVLLGGKKPAQVAKEQGTPVRMVYAATASTRAKLRTDPDVLRLRRAA